MACCVKAGVAAVAVQPASSHRTFSAWSPGLSSCRGFCANAPLLDGYSIVLKQGERSAGLSSSVACSSSNGAASWNDRASEIWVGDTDWAVEEKASVAKKKKNSVAGVDQTQLRDPCQLAEPDSRFADFYGVQIHYKVVDPGEAEGQFPSALEQQQKTVDLSEVGGKPSADAPVNDDSVPAILLHGFGASLFSYERIMKPLARLLQSQVLAFDRPAFGLTSRVLYPFSEAAAEGKAKREGLLNPYSFAFSSAVTRSFMDLLHSKQAILIGHSAGCIVALNAYLEAPERVAAMILLAPALVAPLLVKQLAQTANSQDGMVNQDTQPNSKNIFLEGLSAVWSAVMAVVRAVVGFLQSLLAGIQFLSKKIFTLVLRTTFATWMLRTIMDRCGRWIVQYAWFNPKKVDDYVLNGYTKPLGCKNWDKALVEFVIGLAATHSEDGQKPLDERLNEITCPVLVVTGDTDRLVPSWNAERLAKMFPKAQFKLIKDCGHCPQEEKVEETLGAIREFLGSLSHYAGGAESMVPV